MTSTIALMKVGKLAYDDIRRRVVALGPDYAGMILPKRPGSREEVINMDGLGIVSDPIQDLGTIDVDDAAILGAAIALFQYEEGRVTDALGETDSWARMSFSEQTPELQMAYVHRAAIVLRTWIDRKQHQIADAVACVAVDDVQHGRIQEAVLEALK